jgi:hypothetical protein
MLTLQHAEPTQQLSAKGGTQPEYEDDIEDDVH